MFDVLLFHHAQGLTDGVRAFADKVRAPPVTTCLYDGRTFPTIDEGVSHAEELGWTHSTQLSLPVSRWPKTSHGRWCSGSRGPRNTGVSLEVMPAQRPDGVPLQMHVMVDDPWDDLEVMQGLAATAGGELFPIVGCASPRGSLVVRRARPPSSVGC